jgi:hypothetical protein
MSDTLYANESGGGVQIKLTANDAATVRMTTTKKPPKRKEKPSAQARHECRWEEVPSDPYYPERAFRCAGCQTVRYVNYRRKESGSGWVDLPHARGAASCDDCGHEWMAVWPLGAEALECPKCHGANTDREPQRTTEK